MADEAQTRQTSWTDARGNLIECIHRDRRILVGITHLNKQGKPRAALIESLEIGNPLVLLPEPDNQFDRNAILVYRTGRPDDDIGYMDAVGAKRICSLIERGATFRAEVSWLDRKKSFLKVYFMCFK